MQPGALGATQGRRQRPQASQPLGSPRGERQAKTLKWAEVEKVSIQAGAGTGASGAHRHPKCCES